MKRAYVAIREAPVYRREAFVAGLKACGYDVHIGTPSTFDADTVFVPWNRYLENHDTCSRVEVAGGVALIAENGYVGPGGASPHDTFPREWYALARSYHNDSTVITRGNASRWDALGIDVKPWRQAGGHILVCPNRSFGTPGRFMPFHWIDEVTARLRLLTKREIRVRPHPGNNAPAKPLAADLAGAWATVIWSSSAGVHSLIAGIPVICEAPFWIAKKAAGRIEEVELPPTPNRAPIFERLAYAQWSLAEITSGEAFAHCLRAAREGEVRAAD
ncbi:MAG TPA: hypothetical protein VLH12_08745 [Usitatibacter sp.]|nr:hypothetical protein [Usitatibacter sp.]